MYLLKNLIMFGRFPIILEMLAVIAKKPITSDEVKKVAIDKNQTPNNSKCCFIIKLSSLIC
jgi:hypothetical protein